MEKEKPEKVFMAGPIQASIFMNERMVKGVGKDIPSIAFQKRYQENGEWKSTTSLNTNDLPRAALVLYQAYSYLVSRKKVNEDQDELV